MGNAFCTGIVCVCVCVCVGGGAVWQQMNSVCAPASVLLRSWGVLFSCSFLTSPSLLFFLSLPSSPFLFFAEAKVQKAPPFCTTCVKTVFCKKKKKKKKKKSSALIPLR